MSLKFFLRSVAYPLFEDDFLSEHWISKVRCNERFFKHKKLLQTLV